MSFPGRKQKIATISLILASLIALGAAGNIQSAGDGIVWKDSQVDPQLKAQCTAENSTVSSLEAGFDSGNIAFSTPENRTSINFSSSDLREELKDGSWGQSADVRLSCEEGEDVSKDVNFASLNFEPVQTGGDGVGRGFLGEIMMKDEFGNREEVRLDLNMKANSGSDLSDSRKMREYLKASNFDFGGSGPLINSDEDTDVRPSELDGERVNEMSVLLYPQVMEYFGPGDRFEIDFQGREKLGGLEKSIPDGGFDPFLHEWSTNVLKDPGKRVSFQNIREGGYVYDLSIDYAKGSVPHTELESPNFFLNVKKGSEDFPREYSAVEVEEDGEDKELEGLEILDLRRLSGEQANYRVKLPNVGDTSLDRLDDRTPPYKFVLNFQYVDDSGRQRSFVVDELLVDKSENPSRFSGQVLDSGGNGVRSEMLLKPVSRDDSYLVSSGSNGQFSKDLSTDLSSEFDMGLDFFQSGNRVTEMSLSGVNLEDANLGAQDISAINFDYWNDPQSVSGLNVEGLKPVNMMAIRFGYDINSVESISMAFDSSELAPRNLKVYECESWNFWGKNCEGQWEKVADNRNQSVVEYPEMWAKFSDVDLYETSGDERILRNAYVVGRSAKLQLQRSISLESTQVKHNGKLKASGVLMDENGNRVNGAEVALSLVNASSGEIVDEWDTDTDATGSFSFDGKVEAEAGNYLLELEALKNPYQPLTMESDETVSVYYEKGLSLDVPASPEINQGEASEISFDVSNTGQRPIENIEINVEGVRNSYYSVSNRFSSLESGSKTVKIKLELPEDYCSYPCSSSPEFNVEVTGESGGESVSSSALIPTTLTVERTQENEEESQSEEQGGERRNETSDSRTDNSSGTFSQVNRMTGNFVQKQGELNIALALIMIFTMVLAAAVKKRKEEGGNRRRGRTGGAAGAAGARPNVSRPDVSSSEQPADQGAAAPDEVKEGMEDEAEDPDLEEIEEVEEEVPENVCDVCGEEFEGSTGVKIHKQAVHE